MTNSELKVLARNQGLLKYSKLNKHGLVNLLRTGVQGPPPPKIMFNVIKNGKGVPPDELFKQNSEYSKWTYEVKEAPGGYMITGVDLTGLFNSTWYPDTTVRRSEDVYYSDTDGEEEPTTRMVTRTIPGGWFIKAKEYPEFKTFISSLRPLNQPKTLFDIAAHVVNSRKRTIRLPKVLERELDRVRKETARS